MRRIISVIVYVFCIASNVFSQVSVTWSDFQDDHKCATPKRVMMNEKYIYFYYHPQGKGDHYYIQIFDQLSFKFIKQIELYPEFDALPRGFSGVTLFKDHIISFRSFYDRKADKNIFYAKKVTLEGDVDKNEIEIGNIEAPMGKSDPGSFLYGLSPDEDELIITENIKLAEDSTNVRITSYTSEFKKAWSKDVPLNKNNQRFKVKDCGISMTLVSPKGDVYLLAWYKKSGTKDELKEHPKYFYNAYVCHSASDAPKQIPLNLDDKYLDVGLGMDKFQDLVVAGTYSDNEPERNKGGRGKKDFSIEGTFYIRIDSGSDKIVASDLHAFSSDFLNSFEEADRTKNQKGIYCFDLNYLNIGEDGSAVISGQKYYYSAAQQTGDAYTVAQAYAQDIFAMKLKNDGAVAWERLIKKSQHGSSGSIPMIGYGVFDFKEDLYFIFNDHPDNGGVDGPTREVKSLEESVGRMVKIDSKGKISRSTLFDNEVNGAAYYPAITYHKSGTNTAVIFSSTEHRFKLGKMQFK